MKMKKENLKNYEVSMGFQIDNISVTEFGDLNGFEFKNCKTNQTLQLCPEYAYQLCKGILDLSMLKSESDRNFIEVSDDFNSYFHHLIVDKQANTVTFSYCESENGEFKEFPNSVFKIDNIESANKIARTIFHSIQLI